MGRQSRSVTRGNEVTDANPEGVEFQSLSMFNPFRVASSMGHSHGFRLALHPWLFTLIPSGDVVVVYAECGIEFMNRAKSQYQFRNRTSIPFSSFSALVKTFKSEFR